MVLAELEPPHLFIDAPVLAVAAVLAVGVTAAGVAERIRLPSLLVFLGAGMLVADDGLELVHFDDTGLAQNLAVLALVLILFDGGLSTSARDLREVAAPATALATVGVGITTAVVAGIASLVFDVDGLTALVIGAVVASTDAAAVFAATKGVSIPHRIAATLEAESGLNDPMAVLLTVGFVAAAEQTVTAGDWIGFGLRQMVLGAGIGVLVGWGGGKAIARVRLGGGAGQPL
ncbi:MAG: cation:proton antiporter, partial [Acidimicrobiia bacterium]|nr:cation:proton antiporter [Acidimicrobiia bacterium]